MDNVIISIAQVKPVLYGPEKNLEKAEELISEASKNGAKAIFFPEMYLTGYTTERVSEFAISLNHKLLVRLGDFAKKYEILIVCGFIERSSDGLCYNSACVIDSNGEQLGVYRKTHLFNNEAQQFVPGYKSGLFDTSIGKIGLMICYELEFPEIARMLAINGAKLIVVPTANMFPYDKHQEVFLKARAMENGVYIALANNIGSDSNYEYCGGSSIVDPSGKVLASVMLEEGLIFAKIDFDLVPPSDNNLNYLRHRRPKLYSDLVG